MDGRHSFPLTQKHLRFRRTLAMVGTASTSYRALLGGVGPESLRDNSLIAPLFRPALTRMKPLSVKAAWGFVVLVYVMNSFSA